MTRWSMFLITALGKNKQVKKGNTGGISFY
jgi:hypothetical protein